MNGLHKYQAHVETDWQRDRVNVLVRQVTDTGHAMALGQVHVQAVVKTPEGKRLTLDDRSPGATMEFRPLTPEEQQGQVDLTPAPGLSMRTDAAVALAHGILNHLGVPSMEAQAREAVETLERELAEVREELAAETASAARWEVLCLAKDEQIEVMRDAQHAVARAADREATGLDLERERVKRLEDDQRALIQAVNQASLARTPRQSIQERIQETMGAAVRNPFAGVTVKPEDLRP